MFQITVLVLSSTLFLCYGIPIDEINEVSRIVGGKPAADGAYPYQASIRYIEDDFHYCGGVIITAQTVLTAGHCSSGPEATVVAVGTNKLNETGIEYRIMMFIRHPEYHNGRLFNDIAVIILSTKIEFTTKIQPISMEYEYIGADVTVQLSGWGTTWEEGDTPNDLQEITLKTVTYEFCKSEHENPVLESQLCTLTKYAEGSCHGDSGSPLTANGKLVGLVSWGYGCARGKPDVFSRISSYTQWIDSLKA